MIVRVVEVQATPNPNAVKLILDRELVDEPISFLQAEAAVGHLLAERLFAIPGVSSLLFIGDFLTINKVADARWADITGRARQILENTEAK